MRLLVVSAHFPPNFVSGGTLVPALSALELARRGHDVHVLAGWIGPGRADGETFDGELDAALGDARAAQPGAQHHTVPSVPVTWFVTNDAIDWGSRRNFDNPGAARAFGETLRRFGPDVVHFHSMQGLGAGLLVEAARRDVPFVVTAHDFWWWCGRQFLCDRDYHPCCPTVVAGVCPCHVDRSWLEERTRFTTAALAAARWVVAVSESAADVVLANGVPPDRVVVLGNPVDDATTGRARARARPGPSPGNGASRDEVRFVFAGGSDPMKGLPVLREALRTLRGTPGWSADLYGVPDGDGTPDGASWPNVRTHPSYAPSELSRVLSEADVLVVPSVMQETYSILTREALAVGVPVVTTACLGPEEVVTDRVNGLVVPQDDPGSLGAAMAELVSDRALLDRLARSAPDVALTSVAAHCDRLEQLYTSCDATAGARRARKARAAGSGARRRVGRVLFVVGIDGAPLRYRAHLPAEELGLLGVRADVRHYRHPDVAPLAAQADAVVVYRVPATFQVEELLLDLHRRGTPVVFDVDDLIFDPDLEAEIPALQILSGPERELWIQGVHRYRTTMERCDAFIGSTERLCDHASTVTGLPSYRFPNGVGIVTSRLADAALRRARPAGPVRVGYLSGTDTHDRDWALVEGAVLEALAPRPDAELWLVGKLRPGPDVQRLGDRLKVVPFQPWTSLPALLRALDVNLAPLEPASRFNDAKSAVKWLEAALSATPTIASPTQPFCEVVDNGVNGLLAHGPQEWTDALGALLDDDVLRRRLGARSRRDALLRLGPWTQGRRYLEILESVEKQTSRASTWVPVLLDEPPEPVALEPYGEDAPCARSPDASVAPRRAGTARLVSLARRGIGSIRRRGVAETARLVLVRARQAGGQARRVH